MQQRVFAIETEQDHLKDLILDVADGKGPVTLTTEERPVATIIAYTYYEALEEIISELTNERESDEIGKDIINWKLYKILFPEPFVLPKIPKNKRGRPPKPKEPLDSAITTNEEVML